MRTTHHCLRDVIVFSVDTQIVVVIVIILTVDGPLEWLQSDSKVFVGTCVLEIQELTDRWAWQYVDTLNNPVDDITRGKLLLGSTIKSLKCTLF